MATILVTDGEQRSALAVVRSLGQAGHTVLVTAARHHSLAGSSRFCATQHLVPNPLISTTEFATELARIADAHEADVIIPISDHSLIAVLGARSLFRAQVPFADLDRVGQVSNKATLVECAARVGIKVPRAITLHSPETVTELDEESLRFPLVIKPGRSVVASQGKVLRFGVSHAANLRQLRNSLSAIHKDAYPLLLQERIVGPGVGIFLLIWNGETQAVFSHRRIREKPPAGGVSVYRESIAADPGLVARSRALLDLFDWRGVAMVEYKVQEQDGTPFLMEINGRFWGSLQLAIDAGVDFPRLLVDLSLGRPVVPVTSYRTAIRSRWWWGDVDHVLARLTKSPAQLALPPGSAGRWRTLAEFLIPWRPGDRNEIMRWGDPVPFLRETVEWIRGR
jgi:predicted ATP-grasp superfamily ATP-dependent carboligase